MKKILPVKMPFITAYPGKANALAILMNHESTKGWIMENFLQLGSYLSEKDFYIHSDFYNIPQANYGMVLSSQNIFCPFLNVCNLDEKFVNDKFLDIIDFIKYMVNRNSYILLYANTKYIKAYNRDDDRNHQLFIYGYDEENELLYIADFFINFKYSFETCSFSEMKLAFTVKEIKLLSAMFLSKPKEIIKEINCISFNPEYVHEFNIKVFIHRISEYLNNENFFKKTYDAFNNWNIMQNSSRVFGNNIYHLFKKYLIIMENEYKYIDVRPFSILCDHKRSLIWHSEYLLENEYIKDITILMELKDILKLCINLRNIIIKINLKKFFYKEVLFLIELLNEIKSKEDNILVKLLNNINVKILNQ